MRTEEAEEICHDAEQYEKKEPDYKEEANMGQQQTSSLASSTNLNRYWLRENAKHILRRSVSGPPFYRGRNRHGVHGNPMASLVSPAVLIPNIRKTERRLYPVDFDASGKRFGVLCVMQSLFCFRMVDVAFSLLCVPTIPIIELTLAIRRGRETLCLNIDLWLSDFTGSPEERLVGQVETEAGKSSLVDGSRSRSCLYPPNWLKIK